MLLQAKLVHATAPGRAFSDKLSDNSNGPEMVVLPVGNFMMGSPISEDGHQKDEEPQHPVDLERVIAMSVHEVTVAQFRQFAEATEYRTDAETDGGCEIHDDNGADFPKHPGAYWGTPGFAQQDTQPVVCVSWNDANRYVQWLSDQTGKIYRLPSDSEWEVRGQSGGPLGSLLARHR